MRSFHGGRGQGPFFEGWYLKHQRRDGGAIAFIPSYHREKGGRAFASLQVITGDSSWSREYPEGMFWAHPRSFQVRLGDSFFSTRGIRADLELAGLRVRGQLDYGPFAPPESDMMGPFRMVPFLQCRHGVLSLSHPLSGSLWVNGEEWDFDGGRGYLEKDWGSSFPDAYLWSQCCWEHRGRPCSVMVSVASVPLGPGAFTGCICAVLLGGRQLRVATYLGARVLHWDSRGALLRQGPLTLAVSAREPGGQPLNAPCLGAMSRVIRESAVCPVRYRFWHGSRPLLDITRPASFEVSLH